MIFVGYGKKRHSERSEESLPDASSYAEILRCAQNDETLVFRFKSTN
jgi:hypothetical protein